MNSLGATIKALRRLRGLTQQQLADRCGLSRTSVTNIELGRHSLTQESIVAIADALGYDVQIKFVLKTPVPQLHCK